ncbi:hypothetical protein ED733_005454 [Metarhizium rileyi]|uniref:Uncharacterized protein n=1 Tax=Metarhizium rileyi (strain RCEF 4871) TaxID=1649241 RepID=A0A5C6GGD0_METRR|nr:hypothetical protein ED733_005454 [Metarhizium rileyi]
MLLLFATSESERHLRSSIPKSASSQSPVGHLRFRNRFSHIPQLSFLTAPTYSSYTRLPWVVAGDVSLGATVRLKPTRLPEQTLQPLCGECALWFFSKVSNARWMSELDLKTIMSTQIELMGEMEETIDELLEEIEQVRLEIGHDWWREFPDLFLDDFDPPPRIASDVLDEIPRSDSTYIKLGTSLIPHRLYPNVKLLEFRTFSGAMAYQPCCKDIDLMGFFKPLAPIEPGVDRIFKVARAWSCIIQSIERLPKDLRWILATIYNFANDMLCKDWAEDTLWRMRPWLMYWYDVADALLGLFNITASAPIPDWFLRPSADDIDEVYEPEAEANVTMCRTNSVPSDGNQTVIRHGPPSQVLNKENQPAHDMSSVDQHSISAWIDAQPDWGSSRVDVDPGPGGGFHLEHPQLGQVSQQEPWQAIIGPVKPLSPQ